MSDLRLNLASLLARSLRALPLALLAVPVLAAGCSDDDSDPGDDPNEVITTVTLAFAPMAGGSPVTASFRDPDGDGGAAPTVDPVGLVTGTTYTMTVQLLNELEAPAENITLEVADESDQHQLFFTGTAINGPATNNPAAPLTHTYADLDANDLPVGLVNQIVAATGTGQLTVTLRHMPPTNGVPAKTAATTGQVKAGGLGGIPGSTDASVTFSVTVP